MDVVLGTAAFGSCQCVESVGPVLGIIPIQGVDSDAVDSFDSPKGGKGRVGTVFGSVR
jgi:hypothetical protein